MERTQTQTNAYFIGHVMREHHVWHLVSNRATHYPPPPPHTHTQTQTPGSDLGQLESNWARASRCTHSRTQTHAHTCARTPTPTHARALARLPACRTPSPQRLSRGVQHPAHSPTPTHAGHVPPCPHRATSACAAQSQGHLRTQRPNVPPPQSSTPLSAPLLAPNVSHLLTPFST